MHVFLYIVFLLFGLEGSAGLRNRFFNYDGITQAEQHILQIAGYYSSIDATVRSAEKTNIDSVLDVRQRVDNAGGNDATSISMGSYGCMASNVGGSDRLEFDEPTPQPTASPTFTFTETLTMESTMAFTGVTCTAFLNDAQSLQAFNNATRWSMFVGYEDADAVTMLMNATAVIVSGCEDTTVHRLRRSRRHRKLTDANMNVANVAWRAEIARIQEYVEVSADELFTQLSAAYESSVVGGGFLVFFRSMPSSAFADAVTDVATDAIVYTVDVYYPGEEPSPSGSDGGGDSSFSLVLLIFLPVLGLAVLFGFCLPAYLLRQNTAIDIGDGVSEDEECVAQCPVRQSGLGP